MDDYDDPMGSARAQMLQQLYYHGKITRVRSEDLVKKNGDYLVRDSISKPGDYVLTACHNEKPLHFQINTTRTPTGRTVYHFEEEQFASIPILLQFYQNHRKPVTMLSRCIITTPLEPSGAPSQPQPVEAREIEAAYARMLNPNAGSTNSAHAKPLAKQAILNRVMQSRLQSPVTFEKKVSIPALPTALANRPLPLPISAPRPAYEPEDDYADMDYDSMEEVLNAASSSATFAKYGKSHSIQCLPNTSLSRDFSSCLSLSTKVNLKAPPPIPPKPLALKRPPVREPKPEDDYDEPKSRIPVKETEYDQLPLRKSEDTQIDTQASKLRDSGISLKASPVFHLLESLNKKMKELGVAEVAAEIGKEDAELCGVYGARTVRSDNALRQIVLPHGDDLRETMSIRSRSMQLVVVLTVLYEKKQAAAVFSLWNSIASELIYKLGDLFGFVNVMQGLKTRVLAGQPWIWPLLTRKDQSSHQNLETVFQQLRASGFPPTTAAECMVPFMHPVLELFGSYKTNNNNNNNDLFSKEIESDWRWMKQARVWAADLQKMRAQANLHFGHQPEYDRYADPRLLSQSHLLPLLTDQEKALETSYAPALEAIEILLQDFKTTDS